MQGGEIGITSEQCRPASEQIEVELRRAVCVDRSGLGRFVRLLLGVVWATDCPIPEDGHNGTFRRGQERRADVKTGTCAPESGTWVLNGTVKTHVKSASYQIVVDFVAEKGFTVLGSSVVNVPNVVAGGTASWSAKGPSGGPSGVECLIRQAQST